VFAFLAPTKELVLTMAERCDRLGVTHTDVWGFPGFGEGFDIPDPDGIHVRIAWHDPHGGCFSSGFSASTRMPPGGRTRTTRPGWACPAGSGSQLQGERVPTHSARPASDPYRRELARRRAASSEIHPMRAAAPVEVDPIGGR
jgi:hypothetical protein